MRAPANPFCRSGQTLVLASQSASRKTLLQSCGLAFENMAPEVDERRIEDEFIQRGGERGETALVLARAKALAVSARATGSVCIGADQIMMLDGHLRHKARSLAEALAGLEQLSGRTHQLVSAFAVAVNGAIVAEGEDRASLTMRDLNRDQIEAYLDHVGEDVLGSVGSYQVEAAGIHLFSKIEGAHSTILGLPMLPLLAALRAVRAINF